MAAFLLDHYLTLKALHLIAVMAWMAGLLYLPRLFVYHAGAAKGSEASETFKVMEFKLLRYIMTPASVAAWGVGGLMLWANPALLMAPWMHVKLLCVVLMTVFHHMLMIWRKRFARDENRHSAGFYRRWNEAPTILMIVIIVMAVVEPF
ncbi:MAG: protoporphyrinogen oxidase HemJ [Alphaproteobacteria bacterium]|nr:protoporphyrinogen oxidase HemJ [Alphaproteobacteria bacterium]